MRRGICADEVGNVSTMPGLRPLDIATGMPLGAVGTPPRPHSLPPRRCGDSARTALEDALRRSLEKAPCLIAFSGGRDSSVLLALATHVARRDGLSLPVAHTLRFSAANAAIEDEWQREVIRRVGPGVEWVRDEAEDLGFLGGVARTMLTAGGSYFPSNAHAISPSCAKATGGAVVLGVDGDGLLSTWRWQRAARLRSQSRRRWRADSLAVVGLARSPAWVKRGWHRRHDVPDRTWLSKRGSEQFAKAVAIERASEPTSWSARVSWFARRRYLALSRRSFDMLERRHDVRVDLPLLDERFLACLAAEWDPYRHVNRATTYRAIVGDLLPASVLERTSKAEFSQVFWDEETKERCRGLASVLGGDTALAALVDSGRLDAMWQHHPAPNGTELLAQRAWSMQELEWRQSSSVE